MSLKCTRKSGLDEVLLSFSQSHSNHMRNNKALVVYFQLFKTCRFKCEMSSRAKKESICLWLEHWKCIWKKLHMVSPHTHHMQLLPTFPSYISIAHKMLLANKQAHWAKQIKPACESNWWGWSGKIQDQQCKQALGSKKKKKGQLLAGWFDMEVLHVIHLHC